MIFAILMQETSLKIKVKRYKLFNQLFISLLLLLSCKEEEMLEFPLIHTGEITEVTETGALFSGKITQLGDRDIIDYGFVWSTQENPVLENASFQSLGKEASIGIYSFKVSTDLEPHQNYFIRAYIRDNSYNTVYGNQVSFTSLGSALPIIESLKPHSVNLGDTLLITGQHFTNSSEKLEVSFGDQPAEVVQSDSVSIRVLVPYILDSAAHRVKVSLFGNLAYSPAKFHLNPPVIDSIAPNRGRSQELVRIYGRNFMPGVTQVNFSDSVATIEYLLDSVIQVRTPGNLPPFSNPVEVKVFDQRTKIENGFYNQAAYITGFSPREATAGDTIIIQGKNLCIDSSENTKVQFGHIYGTVIQCENTEIKVIAPSYINSKDILLSIINGGHKTTYKEPLIRKSPVIQGFAPQQAAIGETIEIRGENFNAGHSNNVYFGNARAEVLRASYSKLMVRVPSGIGSDPVNLKVTIGGLEGVAGSNFLFKPPIIHSFSPATATYYDKITIQGENFGSNQRQVKVYINGTDVLVETFSKTQIVVPVPLFPKVSQGKISINIYGETVTSDEDFTLLPFSIASIWPEEATIGSSFLIQGKNFHPNKNSNKVYIDNIQTNILSADQNEIIIQIPVVYRQSVPVKITIGDRSVVHDQLLNVKSMEAYDFYPKRAGIYDVVMITGINFSKNKDDHQVYIGNRKVEVVRAYSDEIGFKVPKGIPSGQKVTISLGNVTQTLPGTLRFPWTQKADFDGTGRSEAVSFVINDVAYVVTGRNAEPLSEVWAYDPDNDSWTRKADFPGGARYGAVGFSVGNYGYIGTGANNDETYLSDFWQYNPTTDSWIKKADFPAGNRYRATAFVADGKGYVGTGMDQNGEFYNDLWEYNPANNLWQQKSSIPALGRMGATAFSIAEKGYVGLGYRGSFQTEYSDFWGYDPVADQWTRKDYFGEYSYGMGSFVLEGKAYVGLGFETWGTSSSGNSEMWVYDPSRDTWEKDAGVYSNYVSQIFPVAFAIKGKGFIGLGKILKNYGQYEHSSNFWEYDLSR